MIGREGDFSCLGDLYHAKNPFMGTGQSVWMIEKRELDRLPSVRMLGRIVIARIASRKTTDRILRSVTPPDDSERCRGWIRRAYLELCEHERASGQHIRRWKEIESKALEYIDHKKAQGRYSSGHGFSRDSLATFDMLRGIERVA